MEIGKLIGRGLTAEVYEWEKGKILKLFFDKYSKKEWVEYEARIGHLVHDSGVISPAVYDVVDINGRKGIVYQRIYGKSVVECLLNEPWKFFHFIQQTAHLQHNIHQFQADELPSQKEKFAYTIRMSSHILGYKVKRILEYLDSLPDGRSICHGDFYFNNIIVSGNKLVPIDWGSAYRGNPLGDVARTCMIIRSPSLPYGFFDEFPDGFPDEFFDMFTDGFTALFSYPRWLVYRFYLDEYMRLSNARFEDIDAWVLPAAAAKLRDNIPGERKWLLKLIDRRLEQIKQI